MKKAAKCLSPTEIEARLNEAGVQATAQRIAIARYVLCEAEHPTALDVKQWTDLNFPKLSLATVYNTLNVLVQTGLLRELRLPHSDKAIYDDNLSRHHHFYDEKTGELFDVDEKECQVHVNLDKGLKVRDVEVFIRGQKTETKMKV